MALHATVDPKIQAAHGIFGFRSTLAILLLMLGRIEAIAALAIGTGHFLIAGFHSE